MELRKGREWNGDKKHPPDVSACKNREFSTIGVKKYILSLPFLRFLYYIDNLVELLDKYVFPNLDKMKNLIEYLLDHYVLEVDFDKRCRLVC